MINKQKLLVKIFEGYLTDKSEIEHLSSSLSLIQFGVKKVDEECDVTEGMANIADNEGFNKPYSPSLGHSSIFESMDPLDLWEKIHLDHKLDKPVPGSLLIWKKKSGGGEISLVTKILGQNKVETIEFKIPNHIVKEIRDLKATELVGIVTPWI